MYVVKLPLRDLNPDFCPPHFTSIDNYGVIIALRVCDSDMCIQSVKNMQFNNQIYKICNNVNFIKGSCNLRLQPILQLNFVQTQIHDQFYNCFCFTRFHILKSLYDIFIINPMIYISFTIFFFLTRFHILKSLHDIFIINPMIYISFNVHNQTIIHLLISHLIDLFQKI